MRQATLKIKMYAKSVNDAGIMNNSDVKRIMLRFIFVSFGVLATLYMIVLGVMVKNIVERRNFLAETRNLSSEVGDLELSYLSMSKNIDLNYSHSLGFKETKAVFATRRAIGLKTLAQNDL